MRAEIKAELAAGVHKLMGCPSPAQGSHGSQEREPMYADSPRLTATPLGRFCW